MWVLKSSQSRYHEYITSQRISRLRAVYQREVLREHMSDQCYLCEEPLPEEFCPCWTCLEYRKETRNICLYCEQDGFALFPSIFSYLTDPDGPGHCCEHYICCSETCCAQFNFREMLYPRVFAVGKLYLSLKWLKQRNYFSA